MDDFVPCLVPPLLPSEDGRLSPSSVLLDDRAYISAAVVSNATTAVGSMSTGRSVHVSFCLARAPKLSYICVHFPGSVAGPNVGTLCGPAAGTAAVRCVREPPRVISTHADLALIRVPIPGARNLIEDYDYMVYKASSKQPSLHLLPKPHFRFGDNEAAIFRRPDSSYVVACLRNTIKSQEFNFHLYDSDSRCWRSRLLRVDAPERDNVFPIPDTAIQMNFHDTTKVITLGGPNGTIGWVDLWRGILFCNVLDEKPVLHDMPLPRPARSNRQKFCRGCPHRYRDITVVCQEQDIKIKFVEMETRPGDVPSLSPCPVDHSAGSESDSDSDDEDVAYYWKVNIWTMPVPISSWKDWLKDRTFDVTDIVVDDPRHSELLLPLPRHSADPEDARWSLRRLITAHPALGLGTDSDVIYFLSKVDVRDNKGWVIAVNMKDSKLNGVAELDHRKNSCFRRYYVPSEISKHLIKAIGDAGTLKTKFGRK